QVFPRGDGVVDDPVEPWLESSEGDVRKVPVDTHPVDTDTEVSDPWGGLHSNLEGSALIGSPTRPGVPSTRIPSPGVPKFGTDQHREPVESYTLSGPAWEVYPVDLQEYGLAIAGRNFGLWAQVDLYDKVLKPAIKFAFGYTGRLLFSKMDASRRKLFAA